MRRAKIVATLGPASSSYDQLRAIIEAGVDVARMNLSHGSYDVHEQIYRDVRKAASDLDKPVGVFVDLQGPKIRLTKFKDGPVKLEKGATFKITTDEIEGDVNICGTTFKGLPEDVKVGDFLLIDDGKVRLRVLSCSPTFADVEALNAGVISDRKGVNVPGAILPLSALTTKDREDLDFGLSIGIDWVALSFVQRPEDIAELKAIVGNRAWVMAKLEKPSAIESLEAIVAAADGVMVARGDLGVELPPEDVPVIQKRIVRACRQAGKPVIVATQMLESMISSPVPTRAEVSDVATAVYDGVDAVMLSAESASGSYPIEAVNMMDRILKSTELDPLQRIMMDAVHSHRKNDARDAISAAIRTVAETLPVAATVAYTSSGATTLRVAHERPRAPILSMTPVAAAARRLSLVWGVHSIQAADVDSAEEIVMRATQAADKHGFGKPGQALLIIAGTPFGVPGSTNLLRIAWIGDEPEAS